MIWGYPHSRKPPYEVGFELIWQIYNNSPIWNKINKAIFGIVTPILTIITGRSKVVIVCPDSLKWMSWIYFLPNQTPTRCWFSRVEKWESMSMEIKVSGYFQELFIPKYVYIYIYNMYTIFKHMIHIIVYPNLRGNMMNMMINPWPAASHPGLAPISQVLPTNLLLLHFHWTQSPLHLGTNPTSGEKNRAFLVIWKNIGKFKNQIGIYIYI